MQRPIANSKSSKKKVENPNEMDFFGSKNSPNEYNNFDLEAFLNNQNKKENKKPVQEFTIFNKSSHQEEESLKNEVKQLTKAIKTEVDVLKKQNKAISSQIIDIEKQTLSSSENSFGVYQVRFLESLLSFVRFLQTKASEANTWLSAINSRKRKKGFLSLSKSKGTQYSMSQELQATRSTQ